MSRRHSDEIEFGSDSFLDVVANIVGILIILIVVAGIKAGATPATAARVAEYLRQHAAPAVKPAVSTPAAPTPHLATPPKPALVPTVIPPSPELVQQADHLKVELADLESASRTANEQISLAASEDQQIERRIARLKRAIEGEKGDVTQEQLQLAQAENTLVRKKNGLLQLEVDVQKATAQKPETKVLEHQLTPLSRAVQGKEMYFQLLNNRVAYVPIQELMERLRPAIAEQRSRLMREGIQQGQVGPVAGFHMDYIVRVRRLSTLDELREGSAATVALSLWRAIPEPDVGTEGADEALKDGSDFLRYLRGADADTAITFWVYPDSFEIYRRLQEFAHHENLTVAGRPIPMNYPIQGSAGGSQSSGQ